jgi:hypothetical protein
MTGSAGRSALRWAREGRQGRAGSLSVRPGGRQTKHYPAEPKAGYIAFWQVADAIITVRNVIRKGWTLYRWDNRPTRRP